MTRNGMPITKFVCIISIIAVSSLLRCNWTNQRILQFVDKVIVEARGGRGGNGCISHDSKLPHL
jgi:hypothetical protein